MSKLILLSFADKRFRNSLVRLEKQTRDFPFDERFFMTQDDVLSKSYWRNLKPWLYRRGYGFWSWKALIINSFLGKLNDGDVIFWSDAGLFWNFNQQSLGRFNEYVSMLDGENDIVVFEQETIEQEWTKGDVLKALNVYDNKDICESKQFWGGLMLFRNTERMRKFWKELEALYNIKKELITDLRSSIPNKPGFKEHRHDQSIFSVKVKQIPHAVIPASETHVVDGNWDKLSSSPVQGRRLKEQDRPKSEVIKNKLMMPWRTLLHFYFRKIRHYEYLCDHYPW